MTPKKSHDDDEDKKPTPIRAAKPAEKTDDRDELRKMHQRIEAEAGPVK